MSDLVDEANELTQRRLDSLLRNRPPPPPESKTCLNCGEALHDRVNFCDADCRDDYEKHRTAKQRNIKIEDDD